MIQKLSENIGKIIVGKEDSITKLIVCLLSRGHILIEDVPGVGKTTLVKAMAKSIDLSYSRIQFTPDLLPSDILGVTVYDKNIGDFKFRKGPIHSQIILADEINRTSPKTQSSLLEVMEENQVTIDGNTYVMKEPFMVIATQNPVEYEGTFPLPEAQLDRFLMKISLGYPSKNQEISIISNKRSHESLENLKPVVTAEEIINAQKEVEEVFVSDDVKDFIAEIIIKTREDSRVLLGCSPRATLALYYVSKAYAYINNRTYVIPKDVKNIAKDVLSHRLVLKPETKYKGITKEELIDDIISQIKISLVRSYEK